MQLDPKVSRIAIPSKGRLHESTIELLNAAGINFRKKERSLFAHAKGLELTILFVRPDDIPVLIAEGAADLGIVGRDLVCENGCDKRVVELLPLDYGHCRLAIATLMSSKLKTVKALEGKTIAVSMINTARAYFKKAGVKVNLIQVSGSVEIMVALGIAEGIVDLVETGDTLRDNGLDTIETISTTEAVLIGGKNPRNPTLNELVKRRLQGVLTARQYTLLEYNILKTKLKEAEKVAPGYDSPTVTMLEDQKLCAVKVMVPKKRSIEIIDKLEALGASAIMETGIINCRL